LGKGRRLPYAVHPPATERDDLGFYIRPKAICYVPDWYTGFAVLSAYHAGTYTPGLEVTIAREVQQSSSDLDAFCLRVLKDRCLTDNVTSTCPTFREVYEQFMEWKFGENAMKVLAKGTQANYRVGFNHLSRVHDIPLDQITLDQLQSAVNDCPLGRGIRTRIVTVAHAVYEYAIPRHICSENASAALVVPSGRESQSGIPFSEDDLRILWQNSDKEWAEFILILCYSGYRVNSYRTMEVNLKDRYFKGGSKTSAGKERVVPIHSAILPLVERRMQRDGVLLGGLDKTLRKYFSRTVNDLGIETDPRHTPHDCRHTFSMLCEKYGVREADRKRMMGHSFGGDITNAVYGHRTVEDLRIEIEKIKLPKGIEKCEQKNLMD
jgi:integrase